MALSNKKYLGQQGAEALAHGVDIITPRTWVLPAPASEADTVITEDGWEYVCYSYPTPDSFKECVSKIKIGDRLDIGQFIGETVPVIVPIVFESVRGGNEISVPWTHQGSKGWVFISEEQIAFAFEYGGDSWGMSLKGDNDYPMWGDGGETTNNSGYTYPNWTVGEDLNYFTFKDKINIALKSTEGVDGDENLHKNWMLGRLLSKSTIEGSDETYGVVVGVAKIETPGSDTDTKIVPGIFMLSHKSSWGSQTRVTFYPLLNIWEDIYSMKSDIATHANAIKALTPKKKFRGQIYMPEYRKLSDEDKIRVATINGRVVAISPTGHFEVEVADDEVLNPRTLFKLPTTGNLLRNIEEYPNTHLLTDMNAAFRGYHLLKIDTKGWNTGNVTKMNYAFCELEDLISLDVSTFDTSKVTTLDHMFYRCRALTNLDVSGWDTGNVTTMHSLFCDCNSLQRLDLRGLDTSRVTEMSYAFHNCSSLKSLDLNVLDTSNVASMNLLLRGCTSLSYLLINGIDTGNVESMGEMFRECYSLVSLDISSFDTSKVVKMGYMFEGCNKLRTLTLGVFDMSNADIPGIFTNCYELRTVTGQIVGIGQDISLASTGILTNDSAMVFINGLAEVEEPHTITFHKSVFNKLTPEQIAVATAKGWSVVSA